MHTLRVAVVINNTTDLPSLIKAAYSNLHFAVGSFF
jgi:hypothetical protein